MLIFPRFYIIQILGKNRSRQWSSRGQKLYKNLFADPAGELTYRARPDPLVGRQEARSPLPKILTPLRPFWPRLTICRPQEKTCGRPCSLDVVAARLAAPLVTQDILETFDLKHLSLPPSLPPSPSLSF